MKTNKRRNIGLVQKFMNILPLVELLFYVNFYKRVQTYTTYLINTHANHFCLCYIQSHCHNYITWICRLFNSLENADLGHFFVNHLCFDSSSTSSSHCSYCGLRIRQFRNASFENLQYCYTLVDIPI